MSIGSRIKEQRNKLGYTQPELAEKLDMSLDSIKKMETDRMKPSVDTLIKLTELFNCSADYLLGTDDRISSFVTEVAKRMNIDISNDIDKNRIESLVVEALKKHKLID